MKVDIVMPKMGESLQEGTITKWLKKTGDKIERDEMILEISTDKVDTEVPAPKAGVLEEILAEEGDTVEVGEKIAVLETEGNGEEKKEKDIPKSESEEKEEEEKKKKEEEEAKKEEEGGEEPEESESETEESDDEDIINVVMPKMGESLQEGTITKWLKSEGDQIERDEMILEISTDKVDTEVPAPKGGTLVEILADEGDTVEVGEVIAKLSVSGKAPKKKAKKEEKKTETKEKKADTKPGDKEEKKEEKKPAKKGETKKIPRKHDGRFYSPLVRTMAEKEGVTLEELDDIDGSGVDGRVTKQDLQDYIEKRGETPSKEKKTGKEEKKTPKISREIETEEQEEPLSDEEIYEKYGEDIEIEQMDRIRGLIAEHMVYSKHTSPHVTSVHEADLTKIVKFREKYKESFREKEGFKLTFTPFIALATIQAIQEYSRVNVSVEGKKIIKHKHINLGIATALPDGNLIVPVVKKAETLSLTGLARQIYDLTSRARKKQLNPDEISGGTFTITNFGTFGTLVGAPIINQPETAILGVGTIQKRPVVKEIDGDDIIAIRNMCYLSLTFDHRIIDGMLAGQSLSELVNNLEKMDESNLNL